MATPKRCLNCFAIQLHSERCANCGHTGDVPQHPLALQPGSMLDRRILIGKSTSNLSAIGFSYQGWIESTHTRVIVHEYFPRGLVSRNLRNGKVTVYAKNKQEFEAGISTFATAGEKLSTQIDSSIAKTTEQILYNDTLYHIIAQPSHASICDLQVKHNVDFTPPYLANIVLQFISVQQKLMALGLQQTDPCIECIFLADTQIQLAGIFQARENISPAASEMHIVKLAQKLFTQLINARRANANIEPTLASPIAALLRNPDRAITLAELQHHLFSIAAIDDAPLETSLPHPNKITLRSRLPSIPSGVSLAALFGIAITALVHIASRPTTSDTTPAKNNVVAAVTQDNHIVRSQQPPQATAEFISQANANVVEVLDKEPEPPKVENAIVITAKDALNDELTPVAIKIPQVATVYSKDSKGTTAVRTEAIQRVRDNEAASEATLATSAANEKSAKIAQLLADARRCETRLRFVEPPKDNALKWYQAALELDKENNDAKQGLERLVDSNFSSAAKAIATLDWTTAEKYLTTAERLGAKQSEIERMRLALSAAKTAQQAALAAVTRNKENASNTVNNTQTEYTVIPKGLLMEAEDLGATIVNIHYENGNHRKSAFTISDNGEVSIPNALMKDTYSFVWPVDATSAWIMFEGRQQGKYSFDWPLTIRRDKYLVTAKSTGGKAKFIDLYVNNQHNIALTNNFAKSKSRPRVLLTPKSADVSRPFDGEQLYLRGSMNDWATTTPLQYLGNYTYTASVTLNQQAYEFKFADQAWSSTTNFGGDFQTLTRGLTLGPDSRNLNFGSPRLDPGTYEYTFFSIPNAGGSINFYRIAKQSASLKNIATTASN